MNEITIQQRFLSFEEYEPNSIVESSRQKFERIVGDIPKNQRHILYINKHRWEEVSPLPKVDPLLFDDEPGYHNAMKKVQEFIGDNLGEKVNAIKLCELHDMCVDGVFTKSNKKKLFKKGYSPGWNYGFRLSDVSKSTLKELRDEKILFVAKPDATDIDQMVLDNARKDMKFLCTCIKAEEPGILEEDIVSNYINENDIDKVHKIINERFERYYNDISSASCDYERLSAIARICRAINMFHVFPDGNGRTVLWALLPKLLMENNFCPAILEFPDGFAAGYYSIAEMVEQLEQGMENFRTAARQFSKINK